MGRAHNEPKLPPHNCPKLQRQKQEQVFRNELASIILMGQYNAGMLNTPPGQANK
jgi:hypothetical protein